LIGKEVEVISQSGAPKSGQHFLFLNPQSSTNFLATQLFIHCLDSGLRTIAFTQSRKVTELIHMWVRQLSPNLKDKVSSYRAGFLPEERRSIEKKLARGKLLGVICTSALEMGIDIGYLDVCILVGYPGTIINTWQRGGRVGRSGRDSLIALIANQDALDQYFMQHPANVRQLKLLLPWMILKSGLMISPPIWISWNPLGSSVGQLKAGNGGFQP